MTNRPKLKNIEFLDEEDRDILNSFLELKVFPEIQVYLILHLPKERAKLEKKLSRYGISEFSIKEIYERSEIEWEKVHKLKNLTDNLFPVINKVLSHISEEHIFLISKANLTIEKHIDMLKKMRFKGVL